MVSKNHFVYKNMSEVHKIAMPLTEDTGINFMNYVQHRNDGGFFSLCNDIPDWTSHVYEKHLNKGFVNTRNKSGINYWRSNQELSDINTDARDNFDIDARIDFVWQDIQNNCHHLYSFYTTKKNSDKAYSFYNMHRAKLLKFIAYFNKNAKHLIQESSNPENRIYIADYVKTETVDFKRNYMSELKSENASSDLTDREFEVTILFANGFTVKQIADMFCRSPKTIEGHILKIYEKTGCRDKKSLHIYVANSGWDGLERFFFSYIPDKCTVH